ncbi:MAG: dihydrofolate reductase [Bacteroidales bacterium]|jgi:dihydrofolate reductase|nr:dihydrofolate reductase [Bacteroidales bacterium]
MSKLCIIAAIGNNLEIGYKNQLLCHLPKDLKRFKAITSGYTVLMGDRTWESLPVKPLPNRRNIVITLNKLANYQGCELVFSIEEALQLVQNEPEAFVIGGATIYRLMMQYADELYITRILADFEADAFFPEIKMEEWQLTEEIFDVKDEKNIYDIVYQRYVRIR